MSSFIDALRRAHNRADAIFLRSVGITSSQYAILQLVGEQPGIIQMGVVEASGIDASTVSNIIIRLCKSDLIQRSAAATDARAKQLWLTKRGTETLTEARLNAIGAEQEIISLAGRKIDNVGRVLSRIAEVA